MLKALVAALLMLTGAAALIFAAIKLYENISTPLSGDSTSEVAALGKLRKIYNSASVYKPWTVVYVSIYKHRLKSMVDYSKVLAVSSLVRKNIEEAVYCGLFETAAVIDGNNYVLITSADDESIKNFCEKFMLFPNIASEKGVKRYAALLDIHIGAYKQVSTDVTFDGAVDNARRAAKYALETHEKFCLSNHAVQTKMGEMELIEKDVDRLIDTDGFYMVLQPFIGRGGEIIGGELLSRFRPLKGREVSVHKYLRAIQKEELSAKFDFAVFEKCLSWQAYRGFEQTGIISCNFTRLTASAPDFLDNIRCTMDRYSVNPSFIGIEITENERGFNRERLIENISLLKQMGFLIFLDDFGSGYTSMDDLYTMPIDVLKLDKSLLRHTGTEKGRKIFTGVCAIAKDLGIKVLCEGIENEVHAAFADKADCDILQGYYYYRPMPVSEYEELCDGKDRRLS